MIGWLSGRVVHQHPGGSMIIDVNGVGYEVHTASSTTYRVGESVELFIFTVVRADAILLYGFNSLSDREFFELLLVTPGVGPSTALAALRTMTTGELAHAIETDDVKRVAKIPGIGPKTASRIVLELKGKFFAVADQAFSAASAPSSVIDDALRSLGYSNQEIRQALEDVDLPSDESEALRFALRLVRRQ
ncbi:MAG: Holliday junction branch migration protein RuvA [Acidimicrobiales bacterium]